MSKTTSSLSKIEERASVVPKHFPSREAAMEALRAKFYKNGKLPSRYKMHERTSGSGRDYSKFVQLIVTSVPGNRKLWIGEYDESTVASVPEEVYLHDSLSRKIFEVSGLQDSDQELAWFGKKARALRKFGKISRKQKRENLKKELEIFDEKKATLKRKQFKQWNLDESTRQFKPFKDGLKKMVTALGHPDAKFGRPNWDHERQVWDVRVNIVCPFMMDAAHEIIEEKIRGENDYGIRRSVVLEINEVGVKHGAFYMVYRIEIEYMTDSGKNAKIKIREVTAFKDPAEVIRVGVANLKKQFAQVERKNLKLLLNRAANKIKVPK